MNEIANRIIAKVDNYPTLILTSAETISALDPADPASDRYQILPDQKICDAAEYIKFLASKHEGMLDKEELALLDFIIDDYDAYAGFNDIDQVSRLAILTKKIDNLKNSLASKLRFVAAETAKLAMLADQLPLVVEKLESLLDRPMVEATPEEQALAKAIANAKLLKGGLEFVAEQMSELSVAAGQSVPVVELLDSEMLEASSDQLVSENSLVDKDNHLESAKLTASDSDQPSILSPVLGLMPDGFIKQVLKLTAEFINPPESSTSTSPFGTRFARVIAAGGLVVLTVPAIIVAFALKLTYNVMPSSRTKAGLKLIEEYITSSLEGRKGSGYIQGLAGRVIAAVAFLPLAVLAVFAALIESVVKSVKLRGVRRVEPLDNNPPVEGSGMPSREEVESVVSNPMHETTSKKKVDTKKHKPTAKVSEKTISIIKEDECFEVANPMLSDQIGLSKGATSKKKVDPKDSAKNDSLQAD